MFIHLIIMLSRNQQNFVEKKMAAQIIAREGRRGDKSSSATHALQKECFQAYSKVKKITNTK